MSDLPVQQVHLFGRGMSGRGIRFRELTSLEVDEAETEAQALITADTKFTTLAKYERLEGIKRFIVAVTKRAGLTEQQFMECKESDWEPMTLSRLGMPNTPWSYWTLFAKNRDHLEILRTYSELHMLDEATHEAIRGKRLTVATEGDLPSSGSATGTAG